MDIASVNAINTSEQLNTEGTLIIEGDISGIQAALEIAQRNHKVNLPERTGIIVDLRVIIDRTFPTFNCAACFFTPKTAENGQQKKIGLKTNSDFITTRIH